MRALQGPDTSAYPMPMADKDAVTYGMKRGSGDVQKYFDELKNERMLIGLTNDERERAIQMRELEQVAMERAGMTQSEVNRLTAEYMERLEELQEARQLQEIAEGVGDSFGRAFEDIILGAKTAGEAVKALAEDVARLIVRQMVTQPIANAISSGVSAWFGAPATGAASGAVFNSRQYFPMANGVGMLGEAGPEAVLPLRRTAKGDLGVYGGGSSGSNVQIHNSVQVINETSSQVKADVSEPTFDGEKYITQVVLKDLNSYGPISRGLKSRTA
jgi:phage-related minor tail protein